jgi:Ca-activated chloride channel family protein
MEQRCNNIRVRSVYSNILALLALQAAITLGQGSASKAESAIVNPVAVPETPLHVKVSSRLVQINVTVTDKDNRVVRGLVRDNFTVYDEGAPQNIAHFELEEAPVSVCLIFDASWSMLTKLQKAIEAMKHFLGGARPDDEYCLVRFSDRPQLVAGLSKYPGPVKDSIKAMKLGGATALLDAVLVGMTEIGHAQNRHKALVLVSDGGDNSSRHTESQIDAAVRERDVQIYGIALPAGDHEGSRGYRLMQRLSEQSGGQTLRIDTAKDLPGAARKIASAIRHEYILGYYATESHAEGEYRRVTVELRPPNGMSGLHARWRPGYFESRN